MANKTTSNDILVKVDQNNLIYIDPNTVLSNGVIQGREVEQENLVMYVNLEADLIPRTTLIATNDKNNLTSIAKGTLNFLRNKDGAPLDTTWTDAYTSIPQKKSTTNNPNNVNNFIAQNDSTGQSFGIESIQIRVAGTNFVPQISIKFIDVRGKTLFESPADSPYKAFFHLPWPIYYLTIKGYYGKAIKYRLHMTKFNSKYNSTNANFEIDTTFVGSTYAYLSDIPFDGILNAAYMYPIVSDNSVLNTNTNTQISVKQISKSSKGYATLTSVYQQYIQMGLLPPNFPVKTLREVIMIAKGLEKILEQQIFNTVIDSVLLNGIKEFETTLNNGSSYIVTWGQKNLDFKGYITTSTTTPTGVKSYKWYQLNASVKNGSDVITGTTNGTLQQYMNSTIDEANNNGTFGQNRKPNNTKKNSAMFNINTIPPISFSSVSDMSKYVQMKDSRYYVGYDFLLDNFKSIEQKYTEQTDKIRASIETTMNTVFQNGVDGKGKGGFGFQPTIRNIVGVILANAETYIRLLQDVHLNAFDVGNTRKTRLSNFSTDSIGENIYPWPEIKKKTEGIKQNVLVYPGSSDVATRLGSYDKKLWPEVDFVENFNAIATKKLDPLDDKENLTSDMTWIFEDSINSANTRNISTLTYLSNTVPYCNKIISSILYEIVERVRYSTSFDSFNPATLTELANIEFANLQYQVQGDNDIIDILKSISSNTKYKSYMKGYSPFDRYPYYQDQLPTVPYISNALSQNFSVKKYVSGSATTGQYPNLNDNLRTYVSESYRSDIYPFSSPLYATYLNVSKFTINNLNLKGSLQTSEKDGFICSPHNTTIWLKDNFSNAGTNIFDNTFIIGRQTKHILNTPYFHKQLYSDFISSDITGKYASSAYLLLNSLPFKDLDDMITGTNGSVLMSSLFREVSATHFIPFHLMIKWGSIYHRYKRYLLDGIDIISGITQPIDGELFFDNYERRTYIIPSGETTGYSINRLSKTNIGINPFYYSVFHEITNGYTFFDQTSPGAVTGFTQSILSGATRTYNLSMAQGGNGYGWTTFIDESKFSGNTISTGYTLLPSNGYNVMNTTDYLSSEQENYRILWNIGTTYYNNLGTPVYSGQTFNSYDQYFKDINNNYSISNNNKKVLDLIGTFSPDILDEFEAAFLDFSTQTLKVEIPYSRYSVEYSNFQGMLKEMVYINKSKSDPTDYSILLDTVDGLKQRQYKKLQEISSHILSDNNLISFTMSNPKEINNYILGGFTGVDSANYNINKYNDVQLSQENLDLIRLYLGEDINHYYQNFFPVNNIELSEDNILNFRFLVYIYAGYINAGNSPDNKSFVNYLISNILNNTTGQLQRFDILFSAIVAKLPTLLIPKTQELTVNSGYNDDPIKLELYNFFKSFNDKWIAGNSIGQRTLMEEFIFLDKANRDIGDSVYLDMKKLVDLGAQKNRHSLNLYNMLSILISDTGFDMRALPAYVNFYGTNFSSKSKITPSKTVAKNIFGTFLEVDYQDSMPKIVLQYIGQNSKRLNLLDIDSNAQFNDDSFDISVVNNNPILVSPDTYLSTDFSKSNKAVAFEVSIGDQNQSIFKGLELDQSTIKNTTESFYVLERLGNSESGSSTAQIDIGLYDIYRQASYSCTVTAMGNVMIQPTMFFYLKNIPMYRGSYWITEVSHNITPGGIDTSFKGSRIPIHALPDPKDSFLASYRAMYDSLLDKSVLMVKTQMASAAAPTTETAVSSPNSVTSSINMGNTPINGETVVQTVGFMPFGMPYNGQKDSVLINGIDASQYIQLITYNKQTWLRAVVLEMGGPTYIPNDDDIMIYITKYTSTTHPPVTWSSIKNDKVSLFYSTIFDFNQKTPDVINATYKNTMFLNPQNNTSYTIKTEYDYIGNIYNGPVNVGPPIVGNGIGLSHGLMRRLGLVDNQVVYFMMTT